MQKGWLRFCPQTELKINIQITALLLSCYNLTFPVSQAPHVPISILQFFDASYLTEINIFKKCSLNIFATELECTVTYLSFKRWSLWLNKSSYAFPLKVGLD